MDDGFFRPPNFGTWLALLGGIAILAAAIQPKLSVAAVILVLACGAIASWSVGRWLGRVIGYGVGYVIASVVDGCRAGRGR